MIEIVDKEAYQILKLNRGRANPINTEMVKAIRSEIARVEKSDTTRGLIITGNSDGFFSVGLDLKELYHLDADGIKVFWKEWDSMVMELAHFSKPMIAAINGYSPAGGCVIATTCDYRFMVDEDKYVIGLNEVGVGITVPQNIYYLYRHWIGERNAYHSFLEAKLHNPTQALQIGLVDQIIPMDQVLATAEKKMQQLLLAPDKLLKDSKRNMRHELLTSLQNIEPISIKDKLASWFNPESRKVMKKLVDSLSKSS